MEKDLIEQLYKQHAREAFLYAFSLCKNKSLAEDIVSEAFFKALMSLKDSHTNMKGWIFTVCRSCWIDYLRKNKRIVDVPENVFELNLVSDDSPLSIYIQKEKDQQLYQSIFYLPAHYQEVITLYYFTGLSQIEIAAVLNLSPSAVRVLICRARAKLKSLIISGEEQ